MARKLQIKEGHKILIVNSPRGYKETLIGDLPKNAVFLEDAKGPAEIIQVFVSSKKELEEHVSKMKSLLGRRGILGNLPKSNIKNSIRHQQGYHPSTLAIGWIEGRGYVLAGQGMVSPETEA